MKKPTRMKYAVAISLLALIAVCFFVFYPSRSTLDDLRYNIYCRWVEYSESENALNRYVKLADQNRDILLPVMEHGLVITNNAPADMSIELDAKGRFSIHNAAMSESILDTILKNRIAKTMPFRCFIWADAHSSDTDRTNLINKLKNLGLSPIYLVGTREKNNRKGIDYVVTPCTLDHTQDPQPVR
jgi:biopolymer transport protein ExbD